MVTLPSLIGDGDIVQVRIIAKSRKQGLKSVDSSKACRETRAFKWWQY